MTLTPTTHDSERATGLQIKRALAVLESFDAAHRRQPLSAIARRTGLPLTTTHRLVHELEHNAALERRPDGTYEMGSRIWRLGILASVHADLREVALPYMEDIYEFTNAAVQLAVLDGVRCLVIERIAGSRTIPIMSRPGLRLPLHATGVGKVLLAHGTEELQRTVLGAMDRYTDRTITDATQLRAQLRTIVSRGFGQTQDELETGATSLAVPLYGKDRVVLAALGIVIPSDPAVISRFVPMLEISAAALSRKLIESGVEADSPVGVG